MRSQTIVIERRYCGPPRSANGGYVSGRLASFLPAAAEVTLRHPPPLDTALSIAEGDDGSVELRTDDRVLATAIESTVAVEFAGVPDFKLARLAAQRTFDAALHKIPGCFVCGPARAPGDGLRLHPGPVDPRDLGWEGLLAAPWVPAEDLAGGDGRLRPEFVWAALDCPTAYACGSPAGMPLILLGRQAVHIHRLPQVGRGCVVVSRKRGRDGRKHYADAALYDDHGQQLAACHAVWIEIDEARLQNGAA